jgi:hypothetical protein
MNSRRSKGETVKKQSVTVLFTLICVLGLGLGAQAQDGESVIAKVPHDFVAGNAVLPAGTYKVSRVNTGGRDALIVKNNDTGAGAFLLPTVFEDAPGQDAKLSLQSVGDKYFLSKIQTPNGVYTIALPGSATKLAQMQQKTTSASGSN